LLSLDWRGNQDELDGDECDDGCDGNRFLHDDDPPNSFNRRGGEGFQMWLSL
jgi:hypothetical protein